MVGVLKPPEHRRLEHLFWLCDPKLVRLRQSRFWQSAMRVASSVAAPATTISAKSSAAVAASTEPGAASPVSPFSTEPAAASPVSTKPAAAPPAPTEPRATGAPAAPQAGQG